MEAKDSRSGSYAWRSILQGRDVLLRGSRWRIRNGKSVKIWQHLWLPRKNPPLLSSPPLPSMEDATVDTLIEAEQRQWNHGMIDGFFAPQEAELIKSIPLAQAESEDIIFWPWAKDGIYTCKSGYRFLKEEAELVAPDDGEGLDKSLWKRIWSLHVPNKVKNFIWRACRNSLPTKLNLVRRTVIEDPHCDKCREADEHTLHALWSCPMLDVVWSDSEQWACRTSTQFMDFRELLSWIMRVHHKPELFAITVWAIWTQRNQARHQQPCCDLHQLAQECEGRLAEFLDINPLPSPQSRSPQPQVHWQPPQADVVKINFDGANFSETNTSGIGVIVRDSTGNVLASMSQQLRQAYSAEEIETVAACKALQFASDIGIRVAVLKGDLQILMKRLGESVEVLSYSGALLNDARHGSSFYNQLRYTHVKREDSKVAHSLVRYVKYIADFVTWMEAVPPHCLSVFQADLARIT